MSRFFEIEAVTELLVEKGIITRDELARKLRKMRAENHENGDLTHVEQIMRAVGRLVKHRGKILFARRDVRNEIGLTQEEWTSGYTGIFQGMRVDQPGGAPLVDARFKGVFRRIERGKYMLTDYGERLLKELD